jgi:hypothetical protein
MSEEDVQLPDCDWCSNEFDTEEAQEGNLGVDNLCLDCQDNGFRCYHCEDVNHNDYSVYTAESNTVCEDCSSRYYTYCDPCGEYYHYENRCEDHYYDDDNDNYIIHDYSYQPSLNWFVRSLETNTIVKTNNPVMLNNTPFMGLELEIECSANLYRRNVGEELLEKVDSNWFYLKHDGSLENGFEIVSHPHTLAAFNLRDWSWIKWLADNNNRSWDTDTCGLHVHINKSAFKNNGHIWRFTNLILYNRNQAARLAGRNSHQWASFHKEYKKVGKILKGDESPERYTAVNLTNHRTIEVRMFRGSLHEPRVRAALEFVNANFEYTKDITSHDVLRNDAMSWWTFTTWVQQNESTYPHLLTYLNRIKERSDRVSTML